MNNTIQQATDKALQDFRKLLVFDKYKECVHYGNLILSTDVNTTDGCLTFKTFEIYGAKFLFVCLNGNIINYYELQ